jgi:hypothetical protein
VLSCTVSAIGILAIYVGPLSCRGVSSNFGGASSLFPFFFVISPHSSPSPPPPPHSSLNIVAMLWACWPGFDSRQWDRRLSMESTPVLHPYQRPSHQILGPHSSGLSLAKEEADNIPHLLSRLTAGAKPSFLPYVFLLTCLIKNVGNVILLHCVLIFILFSSEEGRRLFKLCSSTNKHCPCFYLRFSRHSTA